MRAIIQEYLRGLKERDELELVCVNLMNALGLTVLSEPRRGTKQNGVDVLACGKMPDDEVEKVYLLTIKSGDITRSNWTGGLQALKESLDEILTAYCNSTLPNELKELPKEICVCFGGVIREDVRQAFNGYVINNERAYPNLKIHFREWNGSELSKMIENYYLDPRACVGCGQRWLIRAWAMVESPETAIQLYYRFLDENYRMYSSKDVKSRAVVLSRIAFSLAIVWAKCKEAGNLEAAYGCSEVTLLWAWDFLGVPKGEVTKKNQEHPTYCFELVWLLYLQIAQQFHGKISALLENRFAFSLACESGCELDVNQKVFDELGRLASFGLSLIYFHEVRKQVLPASAADSLRLIVRGLVEAVRKLVANNPTALIPLKDDYVVDVSLVSVFLLQNGDYNFLHDWFGQIIQKLQLHLICGKAYPATDLTYKEYYRHGQMRGDDDYRRRVLGSSVLLPMMAYVAAVAGFDDCYDEIRKLKTEYLRDCNFQIWFPDKTSDENFYLNRTLHGKSLTTLDLADKRRFLKRINDECFTSPLSLTCVAGAYHGILFIGCRRYRYPLPPHYLQTLYALRQEKQAESTMDEKKDQSV